MIIVPGGSSFSGMIAQKNKKDIGDQFNKIIGKLATDNDFNNEDCLGKGNAMVDTLTSPVKIFEYLSLEKLSRSG